MKIAVLVENHKGSNSCGTQWGLSFWVEVDGKHFLFDVGGSDLYLRNAEKLGIDLSKTDYLVLSHGHFDHGAGLDFFPYYRPLILHPMAFMRRVGQPQVRDLNIDIPRVWENIKNGREKYRSGILNKEDAEERFELIQTSKPYHITDNAWFLGEIPRKFDFESCGRLSSNVVDDSAVAVKTSKGVVILSGCAHSGICSIIEYAKEVLDTEKVFCVVGGLHFFKQSKMDERASRTIKYFFDNHVQSAYLGHCTSDYIVERFRDELPDCDVAGLNVGEVIEI